MDIHDNGRNGLQALTRAVLGCDLSKDPKIRCGDWAAAILSTEQTQYAALDAVAGRLILLQMVDKYVHEGVEAFVEQFVDAQFAFKSSSKQNKDSGESF